MGNTQDEDIDRGDGNGEEEMFPIPIRSPNHKLFLHPYDPPEWIGIARMKSSYKGPWSPEKVETLTIYRPVLPRSDTIYGWDPHNYS